MNPKGLVDIDPAETVDALVARDPRALEVFQRYGIDTCCGGGLALQVVAERHGLDLDAIVAELGSAG